MKRIISLITMTTLLLLIEANFSGCSLQSDREKELDDLMFEEYLQGLEIGKAEIFSCLYNATPCRKVIKKGVTWEESDFYFTITHNKKTSEWENSTSEETVASCIFYLPNFTLEQIFNDNNIYIGIYGIDEDGENADSCAWKELCSDVDNYLMYSFSEPDSHYIESEFYTYEKIDTISIVIVINGNIYAADYFL